MHKTFPTGYVMVEVIEPVVSQAESLLNMFIQTYAIKARPDSVLNAC